MKFIILDKVLTNSSGIKEAKMDYQPTAEDWAEYCDYLDSIGWDNQEDDWEEDPDQDRGFQNLLW